MNDDVLCVLLAARTIIDVEGWIQGTYVVAGCFCAAGALQEIGKINGTPTAAWDGAFDALAVATSASVIGWNDTPGRTKKQVLSAFDRAIAAEEARLGD